MSIALNVSAPAPPAPSAAIARGSSGALGDLLAELLHDQQATAVERFAQHYESGAPHRHARFYRDLIPLSQPGPGEQYAFEVDLDACSGCKACVVACHNLNGLEASETWRSVGALHGGASELPVLQHVTTACHHCLQPACLNGCPVEAYEKDPVTGIVRHLDDQCIGCQYCILSCPYDVPKYSASKGIVRKCDMCSQRLAVNEAPACVQACPSQAIRIRVVNCAEAAENAEANGFLPGAPEPSNTLPTTIYKSKRPLPANLLPADYYAASSQHAHWPLIWMLVLTQVSVGAFTIDLLLRQFAAAGGAAAADRWMHLGTAFVLGMLGLFASVFHLGRPWLAYRAVIGWRTSWLSREVLAFGGFAAAATVYAALPWLAARDIPIPAALEQAAGIAVAAFGLAGVFCSTMIYASTKRPLWNAPYTGAKFLLTGFVLGMPLALLARCGEEFAVSRAAPRAPLYLASCFAALFGASLLKLASEAAIFAWRRERGNSALRRTAVLLAGSLARVTFARFAMGLLGGVLLPGLLAIATWNESAGNIAPHALLILLVVVTALNFVGELLERYLFFAAVVAPKMPGVQGS